LVAPPDLRGLRDIGTTLASLKYGLPLVPHTLAAFLLNAGGRLIIFRDLGQAAEARYQVTYNASCMAIMLLGAVDLSWEPRLFSINDDVVRWAVLRDLRAGVMRVLLPLALCMSLAIPAVLRVYVPASYEAYKLTDVVSLVVLSAAPFAAYCASMRILLWFKKSGVLALVSGGAAVANIAMNLWLIPRLGVSGSAVATLCGYSLLWLGAEVAARRKRRLGRVSLRTAATVGLTVAGCALAGSMPTSEIWLVARALAGVVCAAWCVVVVLGLGVAGPKEVPAAV
jgi:O-antigen/teichoic acid export membrane protein